MKEPHRTGEPYKKATVLIQGTGGFQARLSKELPIWPDNETSDAILNEPQKSGFVDKVETELRRGSGELQRKTLHPEGCKNK